MSEVQQGSFSHRPALLALLAALAQPSCSTDAPGEPGQGADPDERRVVDPIDPGEGRRALPPPPDGGSPDGGSLDGSLPDGSLPDGGPPDGGRRAPSPVPPLVLSSFALTDGVVKRGEAWLVYRRARDSLEADLDGATKALEELLARTPSYEQAYGALGVAYLRADRYPRCVEVSRRCVERVFDAEILGACYYNLGKCHEHLGEDAQALEAYRWSLEARANDIVEKSFGAVARRLGQRGQPRPARVDREQTVEAAAIAFLRAECPQGAALKTDQPGHFACGPLTVWGIAGRFSQPDVDEALLAAVDQRIEPAKGGGYGVLLEQSKHQWRRLATVDALAPGEGGVDFVGALAERGGTSRPVVQVFDCWQGCCLGSLQVLDVERLGDAALVRAEPLFSVGTSRGAGGEPSLRAMITGVRQLDEARDGTPGLLLRYETRFGSANPAVFYPRLDLIDGFPAVRGRVPTEGVLPSCGKQRSRRGAAVF